MTDKTCAMLNEWLATGTDSQKDHAAKRLSLPDSFDCQHVDFKYPTLFKQAKSAIQAVGSVASAIVHNEPVSVSTEEQDRRLAICHSCEFWDSGQSRCSKCGCFGRFKTWLVSQKCPVDKW